MRNINFYFSTQKFSCSSRVLLSVLWIVHAYFIVINHMAFYAVDERHTKWVVSISQTKTFQMESHLLYLFVEIKYEFWAT